MQFPPTSHDHSLCTAELLERAERTCASNGSRLTDQRRDVLDCVAQGHDAVGAYEIIERMAKRGDRPAPMTVYRALEFLQTQGLVHKIESRNAYVVCTTSHHQGEAVLLICQTCGQVAEQEERSIFLKVKAVAQKLGFTPQHSVIELTGLCAACQNDQTETAHAEP